MADEAIVKPAKSGGGIGRIVKYVIVPIVILIVLVGGGVFGYLKFMAASEAEPVAEAAPEVQGGAKGSLAGVMYDLPSFVVNLADPTGSRYLRVSISVEINPKDKKLQPEIEQRMPKIKDLVITILSSKTLEEISTSQGKISLKQELLRRINGILSSGRLMDVYITEFVVQ